MKKQENITDRLRESLKIVGNKKSPANFPVAFRFVVWELMNLKTRLKNIENIMYKKMHKVTEKMKVAEKDIKKGAKKDAIKTLKKAEKKNEKLVKIDKDVRDPMIKKCKMEMKKKSK